MASHSRWPSRLRSGVATRRHPTSRSPDHRRLSTVRRRHMRLHSTVSHHGLLAVAAVVAPLLACQPDANPVGPSGSLAASRNGVSSTEGLASPGWQGTASHDAFVRGETIGRGVGAAIVTRARADGFTAPFAGTIPVGAGLWFSEATPASVAGGSLPVVRPWFLTSASQFRSAPPPAFGSTAFLAGLREIRAISDTRTQAQLDIATFWALAAGTPTTSGFWIQQATDGINQQPFSERRATHLYALLSATMFDAQIGCWDAKETYWLIRPWQADHAITVVAAVGKPNHPSYPSGHSCLSSSAAEVLRTFFPARRKQLDAMVIEAGLSRMYGGIHYRFDIEAGQLLGRRVAHFTIAADRSGRSVLTPHDEDSRGRPSGRPIK